MKKELGPVTVNRKSGKEQFHWNRESIDFDLLSFWQWPASVYDGQMGDAATLVIQRICGAIGAMGSEVISDSIRRAPLTLRLSGFCCDFRIYND